MTTTDTRAKTIKRRVAASRKAAAVRKKMLAERRKGGVPLEAFPDDIQEILRIAEADMQGLIDWDRGLEDFYKYKK